MNISRLFFITLIFSSAAFTSRAEDGKWFIVGDGKVLMPVSSVRCLVGSDATGLITVIGTDSQITDLSEVRFTDNEFSSADAPEISPGSVTLIDNTLSIKYAAPGTTVAISTLDGKIIHSSAIEPSGADETIIDMHRYPSGIYLVTLNNATTFKIMKR